MKNNKLLVAVVIAVIVLGGAYGGVKYLESRVTGAVRQAISTIEDSSVGSVRFTLPDRKLVITDASGALYTGTSFAYTVKFTSAEVVLPWSLILNSKPEGKVLVAESLSIQGLEYTMPEVGVMKVASEKLVGASTDLALLLKLIAEKKADPVDMASLYERSSVDSYELDKVECPIDGDGLMGIEKIVVEKVNGLRIGSMRLSGLALFETPQQAAPKKILNIASLSMENLDIPANAIRMIFEVSTKEFESPEQADRLMQNLFGGKAPLVGRVDMQDLTVTDKLALSVKSFRFDWSSMEPIRYTSVLEGLVVPATFVAQQTGLQLPNLQNLDMSIKTEVEGDASGAITEHDVYAIKDMFELDGRTTVVLADSKGKGMPMTLWNYSQMEDAAIAKLDLKLTDKNLMAYVLLNMEGPDATGDNLIKMLPLQPGANKEAFKSMMDSLTTFIKQPGTLTVSFAPEKPAPLFELMGVMMDPSAYLKFSSEPGPVPVKDLVKKIQEK